MRPRNRGLKILAPYVRGWQWERLVDWRALSQDAITSTRGARSHGAELGGRWKAEPAPAEPIARRVWPSSARCGGLILGSHPGRPAALSHARRVHAVALVLGLSQRARVAGPAGRGSPPPRGAHPPCPRPARSSRPRGKRGASRP